MQNQQRANPAAVVPDLPVAAMATSQLLAADASSSDFAALHFPVLILVFFFLSDTPQPSLNLILSLSLFIPLQIPLFLS
jgi:hypothetical protein